MISAEVIKGVQELLEKRGVTQKPGERMGDYVARGLKISPAQAETLLSSLHDGGDVDEAARAAGIDSNMVDRDLLTQIARALGSAAANVVNAVNQSEQ